MSTQLSFPGLDTSQQQLDRLFFAIFPEPDAATSITRLAQGQRKEHGLKGKPLESERLHITLHHLGDYYGLPRDIIAAARQAAASVAIPPFDVAFDRVMSFERMGGTRPFVLRGGDGTAALIKFQQSLGVAMAKVGLSSKIESHFTPHVTLLYDEQIVDAQAIETISWTVHEFVLVQSLLGKHLHIPIAHWPLCG